MLRPSRKSGSTAGAILLLITLVMTLACQPKISRLSSAQRASLGTIEIYYSGNNPSWNFELGETIQGVSCRRNAYDPNPPTQSEAIGHLRLRAAEKLADAVVNVVCDATGTNWKHNCWSSVLCIGDVARRSH